MVTKEQMTAIDKELSQTSIANEMATVLLMADAMDMLLHDVDRQIRSIYARNGVKGVKPNSDDNIITGMARYSKAVHNTFYWYFRDVEPRIADGTYGSYGIQSYDNFNVAANELARVVMMIVDRGNTDDGMGKIFEYIAGMKSSGKFSSDDINRLIIK